MKFCIKRKPLHIKQIFSSLLHAAENAEVEKITEDNWTLMASLNLVCSK